MNAPLSVPIRVPVAPLPDSLHAALPLSLHKAWEDARVLAITVDLDTTQVNAPRWVGTPVLVVEGQNGHVQHHHEITSIRALGNPSLLDALLDLVFALHQNTIGCTPAYDVWRIVSDREARMTIKVSFTRYGVGMSQDWDSYEVQDNAAAVRSLYAAVLTDPSVLAHNAQVMNRRTANGMLGGVLLPYPATTAHQRLAHAQHEHAFTALWQRLFMPSGALDFPHTLAPYAWKHP